MTKRILLTLALLVLVVGVIFSQTELAEEAEQEDQIEQAEQIEQTTTPKQTDFAGMAKNTITVDIGPTIVGAAIGAIGDLLGEGEGLSTSGFGIGAQYERNLSQKFSVAARFAYLGGGVGMSDSYTDSSSGTNVSTSMGIDMSSFSIEGHARFYPGGKAFFLDGMLGYANMAAKFSGNMIGTVDVNGVKEKKEVSVNMDASQGFFKLGAKIGWRISFGKNGGFTFEPAFGYSFGFGIGDPIGDQLSKQIKDDSASTDVPTDDLNMMFDMLQNFIFIGGPRMTLAFGWRF
jgi:hypothetical protein